MPLRKFTCISVSAFRTRAWWGQFHCGYVYAIRRGSSWSGHQKSGVKYGIPADQSGNLFSFDLSRAEIRRLETGVRCRFQSAEVKPHITGALLLLPSSSSSPTFPPFLLPPA
jgi:hypothetical protein